MAGMVEMHYGRPSGPGKPENPGFRIFDCGGDAWRQLREVMKAYGWEPQGTQQLHEMEWQPDLPHTDDYDPLDYLYGSTIVGPKDAELMVKALDKAIEAYKRGEVKIDRSKQVIIVGDEMTTDQLITANAGVTLGLLVRFRAFVAEGPFRVNWDD